MATLGLILSVVGVIVLAVAQNLLDRAVRLWLTALDFTVETLVTAGNKPICGFFRSGKRSNKRNQVD
jgi:hypothetical protein